MASVNESDNKTEHVSERIQTAECYIVFCCCCRLVSLLFFYRLCTCSFVCLSVVCLFFWKILCRPRNWRTQHCMQSNVEMAPRKKGKKWKWISPCRQLNRPDLHTILWTRRHKQIRKSSGDTRLFITSRLNCLTTQYKTRANVGDRHPHIRTHELCNSYYLRILLPIASTLIEDWVPIC